MEAFGKVHPSHRSYHQWDQMREEERQLHRRDMAHLYVETAARYQHDAIFLHPNPGREEEIVRQLDLVRQESDEQYFTMIHGDATYGIPSGSEMTDFTARLVEEPEKM